MNDEIIIFIVHILMKSTTAIMMLLTFIYYTLEISLDPPALDYTYHTSFEVVNGSYFVHITPDDSRILFYRNSPGSSYFKVYDFHTWEPINDTDQYYFPDANNLIFFSDQSNNTYALFATTRQIKLRTYKSQPPQDRVLYSNWSCDSNRKFMSVSTDGTKWAITCFYNDPIVLVGKINQTIDSARTIALSQNMTLNEVMWRPDTNQLITIGQNIDANLAYIVRINGDTLHNNSDVWKGRLVSIVFSPAGLLLFVDRNKIVSYNLSTDIGIISLACLDSLCDEIYRRGNLLKLQSKVKAEHAKYDYIFSEHYYSYGDKYENNEHFNLSVVNYIRGQTMNGPFVFALHRTTDNNTNNLTIYKLCKSEGYFYNQSSHQCQKCQQQYCNCLFSATQCISCVIGSYFIQSNRTCVSCQTVLDHCLKCTKQACFSCVDKYYFNNSACYLCQNVINQCQACQNQYKCTRCNPTHYVSTSGQCKLCSTGVQDCELCVSETQCSKCFQSYAFYRNICIKCQEVIENCRNCDDNLKCTQCQESYTLSKNTCLKCQDFIKNCLNCTQDMKCSQCQEGYTLSRNSCVKCQDQIEHCAICDQNLRCTQCQHNYTLSKNFCFKCQEHVENCISCDENMKCTHCQQSYHAYKNSCIKCKQIIQNCLSCTQHLKCAQCQDEFTYDGQINRCVQTSHKQTIIVIVAVVAMAGLVFCVAFIVRQYYRKKLKQMKRRSLIPGEDPSVIRPREKSDIIPPEEEDYYKGFHVFQ